MSAEIDVAYATAQAADGGAIDLRLDIFRPKAASHRTAVLYVHGGGWRAGSRAAMHACADAMAAFGFLGLTAQYRLLGQALYPAQIHDVKAAIRWTRAHADRLGIDPTRIVLWGASAGAHLSLLAAGTPDDPRLEGDGPHAGVSSAVAAVIALFPPTGFFHGAADARHTMSGAGLLGEGYSAAAARDASPITYAGPGYPPTLLLHGTQDRLVHHSASVAMHDALRAAGAPVDLHLFHGHTHEFTTIPSARRLVVAEAAYFLERAVVDPAGFEAEALEHSMFARRAAQARAAALQDATP